MVAPQIDHPRHVMSVLSAALTEHDWLQMYAPSSQRCVSLSTNSRYVGEPFKALARNELTQAPQYIHLPPILLGSNAEVNVSSRMM
jgi:hypothetical protein